MQTILGPRLSEVEVKFDLLGWQASAFGSNMGVMLNERQAMYVIGAIKRLSGLTFGVAELEPAPAQLAEERADEAARLAAERQVGFW